MSEEVRSLIKGKIKLEKEIDKLKEENEKLKSLLKKYYNDEEIYNAEFAYMENDLGFNEVDFGEN